MEITAFLFVSLNIRIDAFVLGDIHGTSHIGGIAGVSQAAAIRDTYVGGTVDGKRLTGGLVGYMMGHHGSLNIVKNAHNGDSVHGSALPDIGGHQK